jgi:hypothetical protein
LPGAAFTKYFYNFSTIIPSTILLQANPDAPNSSKRGRIVEKLWKNCRKILRTLVRQARIVEKLYKYFACARPGAKYFYNFSTILPRRLPDEGPQNLSTILPRFEEFGASGLAWRRIVEGIIVEKLWKHLVNAAELY